MHIYQRINYQYPDLHNFVAYVPRQQAEELLGWLNEVLPDRFIVPEYEVADEYQRTYWLSVFLKDASAATLFKLTWPVINTTS